MTVLELSRNQAAALIEHAEEESPNECCGLLVGRGGKVDRVIRGINTDQSPLTYNMDLQTLKLLPKLEDEGLELIALYHSHPRTRAYPSTTDVAKATYPNAHYLIVSLANVEAPEVRAFRIVGEPGSREVSEESVIIR